MDLKTYLLKNNVSQAEFAERIDRTVATVSRLINRKVYPNPETMQRIMAATKNKVTANDFHNV